MTGNNTKTACERCGTCCKKGGPALHYEDKTLLQQNFLNHEQLITIRKGEPILSLAAAKPEPARSEIVKIKGRGGKWTCIFFQEKTVRCAIYEHRPLECSLLQCWDTRDLEKVANRNLLCRYDIIEPDDPILPCIKNHEQQCSLENLVPLVSALHSDNSRHQAIADLTRLVHTDLAIRAQALAEFHLSLDLELFFFGRPLFKILHQFGIKMHEENDTCSLTIDPSPSPVTLVTL